MSKRQAKKRIPWVVFGALSVLSLILLSSCAIFGGTEIPSLKANKYAVSPPKDWVPKDRGEGDYAYRLPSGSMVSVNSSCNRHLETPVEILTRQLLIGSRNVEYQKTDRLKVTAGEGLYTNLSATYEKTPFHLILFVVKSEKCIFDFSLVSPKVISPSEEEAFQSFLKSFQYGKP